MGIDEDGLEGLSNRVGFRYVPVMEDPSGDTGPGARHVDPTSAPGGRASSSQPQKRGNVNGNN